MQPQHAELKQHVSFSCRRNATQNPKPAYADATPAAVQKPAANACAVHTTTTRIVMKNTHTQPAHQGAPTDTTPNTMQTVNCKHRPSSACAHSFGTHSRSHTLFLHSQMSEKL
jgi:hypothetical protein